MMTRCWFWHAWDRWEPYEEAIIVMQRGREEVIPGTKLRQRRRCQRCGLTATRDT
jgi:hypothetical protein